MKTREDVESYLMKTGLPYDQIGPAMWKIKPQGEENLVIDIAEPVVVFRMKVMELPRGGREALFDQLLRLNASDMVHGAFGIEKDSVVIGCALELENLDFNEFQAVIDDISIAIGKHYPALKKFHTAAA